MVNIKEFITSVVAIILLFVCSACESAVAPTNPNDSDLGNVEFVVDFNQNNTEEDGQNKGDGTAESPAQVTEEEPLYVVVSQESSYTHPNGKVYTCKPKASISVVALEKRVYAEDIEDTEDSNIADNEWHDTADHDIGDDVSFKLTATLPASRAR